MGINHGMHGMREYREKLAVRYQISVIKRVADGENGPFMSSSEAGAVRASIVD